MTISSLPRVVDKARMADWAHLKSEFDWVYEGVVPEPYRKSATHHPGQSALLILKGDLSIETEKGRIVARKNQWVFPHQGSRLQEFSTDARVLSLHFSLNWPGAQPLFNWDIAQVIEGSEAPLLEKRARSLLRLVERAFPGAKNHLLYQHGDLKTHILIQKNFASWISAYVGTLLDSGVVPSRLGQADERVLQAVNLLDELPAEVEFDGAWLSHEVGLSPSQLDRLFIKQFDMTPRQYLEKRKLLHAFELMRSSALSIKQIAYEVGFHSLPYFSRWFRQKAGLSPRQFQKGDIFQYQGRTLPTSIKSSAPPIMAQRARNLNPLLRPRVSLKMGSELDI